MFPLIHKDIEDKLKAKLTLGGLLQTPTLIILLKQNESSKTTMTYFHKTF